MGTDEVGFGFFTGVTSTGSVDTGSVGRAESGTGGMDGSVTARSRVGGRDAGGGAEGTSTRPRSTSDSKMARSSTSLSCVIFPISATVVRPSTYDITYASNGLSGFCTSSKLATMMGTSRPLGTVGASV
jgi:hypothetical protein